MDRRSLQPCLANRHFRQQLPVGSPPLVHHQEFLNKVSHVRESARLSIRRAGSCFFLPWCDSVTLMPWLCGLTPPALAAWGWTARSHMSLLAIPASPPYHVPFPSLISGTSYPLQGCISHNSILPKPQYVLGRFIKCSSEW